MTRGKPKKGWRLPPRTKGMQMSEKFNGKQYRKYHISYSHKSSAKQEAKKMRKTGKWYVRVVKGYRMYSIYRRPKTKMHKWRKKRK